MTPAGERPEAEPRSLVERVARGAAGGAVAGLAGTIGMSLLMLPAQRLGLLGTQPPRRLSDRLIETVGLGSHVDEPKRQAGTTLTHLGTGALAGAVLGGFRGAGASPQLTPLVGTAFGAAFWAVAYVLVAPAIELLPRPDHDRPGRPPVMFAAHVIYGVITAMLIEGFQGGSERPDRSRDASARAAL